MIFIILYPSNGYIGNRESVSGIQSDDKTHKMQIKVSYVG